MKKAGYTIVEMLFVVAVFGLIATGLSSMYILVSKAESAGTAEQRLIAGSRVPFEGLVQDLKYNVLSDLSSDGTRIELYEPTSKEVIIYEFSNECAAQQSGCIILTENEKARNITPKQMEVSRLQIQKDVQSKHPLYHIYMEVKSLTQEPVTIEWETSISSRHYGL
jgi:prepilin-type N-terminal cleavage/methylation domain-containing protein